MVPAFRVRVQISYLAGPRRVVCAACSLHYSGTTEPFGIRTLLFTYYIVPAGGGEEDALVRGNLWTATVQAAKDYMQGVTAPSVKDRSGLEVILQDQQGNELFRCRHKAGPP